MNCFRYSKPLPHTDAPRRLIHCPACRESVRREKEEAKIKEEVERLEWDKEIPG